MAVAKKTRLGEGAAQLARAALLGAGVAMAAVGCGRAERSGDIHLPDGRRLHLTCMGQGAPVVLFESGFGGDAGAWFKVQPVIAKQTRACAYDRAGYGQSDPGPTPRDGAAIAKDLDDALRAARIAGPYVLVGHSAGGLYVRVFADRRPGDVAGMVLVDPSVEYQDRQLSMFGPRAADLSPIRQQVERCMELAMGWAQPPAGGVPARCRDPKAPDKWLPASLWRTQISELDTLWGATSQEVASGRADYGAMPLVVLTAGQIYAGVPEPLKGAVDARWRTVHQAIAHRSSTGEERLVDSPHLMMIARPDAVIQAVEDVLSRARAAARR